MKGICHDITPELGSSALKDLLRQINTTIQKAQPPQLDGIYSTALI